MWPLLCCICKVWCIFRPAHEMQQSCGRGEYVVLCSRNSPRATQLSRTRTHTLTHSEDPAAQPLSFTSFQVFSSSYISFPPFSCRINYYSLQARFYCSVILVKMNCGKRERKSVYYLQFTPLPCPIFSSFVFSFVLRVFRASKFGMF